MRRPELTRRLILEDPQRTPDGSGGYTTDWVEVGRVWADVKPGTGRERGVEAMTVSQIPYRITLRAAPEGDARRPRPEQRFRTGSRIFRILAVSESDAGGRFLTCFAQEEISA